MLDQDPEEALDAAIAGAVDHHGCVALSVGPDVGEAEPRGHREVELDRAALPRALQHVADVEIDLRAVERAVALVQRVRNLLRLERAAQRGLRLFPDLVAADALRGTRRQLDPHVVEPELRIHLAEERDQHRDLRLDLLGRAEVMRVVLRERLHAEQAVADAGQLAPVHEPHLREAQRELVVAARPRPVHEQVPRAVHRLTAIGRSSSTFSCTCSGWRASRSFSFVKNMFSR